LRFEQFNSPLLTSVSMDAMNFVETEVKFGHECLFA
jgi:hypothetical protein